jgi:Coenzyme PQQ synthesis protein D (PqqD)
MRQDPKAVAPTDASHHVRPCDHVLVAKDGGGCVLVDLLAEQYYSLNHSGAFVWQRCAEGAPLDVVITALATEYGIDEDTCRADVRTLVARLVDHRLVTIQ